jgi:hypothetical protein
MRRLFYDPSGPLGWRLQRKGSDVLDRAKANAPQRSGELAGSLQAKSPTPGGQISPNGGEALFHIDVGTDLTRGGFPYPLAQELGVGVGGRFPLPAHQQARGARSYRNAYLVPALRDSFPGAIRVG